MSLSRLVRFINSTSYSPKPFEFDDALPGVSPVLRLISNQLTDTPSHNDNVEFSGDAVHNLATRLASRRYVQENSNLDEISTLAAVEMLYLPLTQNVIMGRIFAKGGLDFDILRVSPTTKQNIDAFAADPDRIDPPKELANFMEGYAWAINLTYGFDALVDHYREIMRPIFHLALQGLSSGVTRRYEPQQPLMRYFSFRAAKYKGVLYHQGKQYKTLASQLSDAQFQKHFRPLSDVLAQRHAITFRANGDVRLELVDMLALGDDVLGYLLCTWMDSMWPKFRVADSRGPEFFTNIKRLILCDESITFIVRKAKAFGLPPDKLSHTNSVSQTLSIAVGILYLKDPAQLMKTLRIPLGILLETARTVVSSNSCLPVLPAPPYMLDPSPVAKKVKGNDGLTVASSPSATPSSITSTVPDPSIDNETEASTLAGGKRKRSDA